MEPRAHHVLIGFFTLAVTLAAMAFGLWLVKSGSDSERQPYDIVFNEDVKGLSTGSAVLYSGIRVGEVTSLRLDSEDPRKVWTRVKIDKGTPITRATTARMSLANITGASVIHLQSTDPDSPPLKAEAGEVPVIVAAPSPFTQLKTSGEELLYNVSQLIENANEVFSTENATHLNQILTNLNEATAAVAGEKDAISSGLNDLAQASGEFRTTLKEATTLLSSFNRRLDTQGDEMIDDARQSLGALREVSTSLNTLIADNENALSQSIQGLAEMGPLLQELRATIATVNNIARRMEQDPGGFLLGGEKIREFEP